MTLEQFNSIATFGTFLVIAATAIAALYQLRHARGANVIEAFGEIQRRYDSEEFKEGHRIITSVLPNKWQDPAFRYEWCNPNQRSLENDEIVSKMLSVANTYEELGLMVKHGFIAASIALDMLSTEAIEHWTLLSGPIAAKRRKAGDSLWENFEYFVVLSEDWEAAHPHGSYPRAIRRLKISDELRGADEAYAASLAHA